MAADLFCCERLQPEPRKAEKDPVIFMDSRVIPNLLHLEPQYIPSCNYFAQVQTDVKPFMRKVVTTWMLEVRPIFVIYCQKLSRPSNEQIVSHSQTDVTKETEVT